MCPTFPSALPVPLLTLRLGSSSVLDTLVLDVADEQQSILKPVFSIETDNEDTSVYRLDHDAHPDNPTARLVAAIKWSSSSKSLVSIDGQTHFTSAFLKKTVLGGWRKFHVPGQSNGLKWKHVGAHYECTLCSHACTAHRAVATLDPGHTTALPRLNLYTSSVSSNNSNTQTYKNVDESLLDHLIVTAILLLRKDKDLSGSNTPSTTTRNTSHFLAPTTPTTISSSSSGSYSPIFSTSPAAAMHRSTSTRSTRSGARPVLDLLEDEDMPSPITPYSPTKPPHSPMLKPIMTNSPRLRTSPMLKSLSACPSPFSSASSSSSVAGGSVSSLPASPVTPFSHVGAHSPLNQDTFATVNFQVLNGPQRATESVEENTMPFQIPLPASYEQSTLSHSTSYSQLRSPASASSTATFTQSPINYIPSTHYVPSPTSPNPTIGQSQRTYAPTPTRPPATSTNNTIPVGRSHSQGGIPRKIANKLPSPILSSLAFFQHHSRARANNEDEKEAGPGAITPYQLPPTPMHAPPPPPSAPATMTTYHAHSMSLGSSGSSTISRDATITPYTLPPRTVALPSAAHQSGNALLLETDTGTNTSSLSSSTSTSGASGPSPVHYTTEMYHIMFETGQYASNPISTTSTSNSAARRESATLPQQRRESASYQQSRRGSMPPSSSLQTRRDSGSGAARPLAPTPRIFQEVPAPSASDLEALGIVDFFGSTQPRLQQQQQSHSSSSPRTQARPVVQLPSPRLFIQPSLPHPSSPRLDHRTRSPITRTLPPVDDFEHLGPVVDDQDDLNLGGGGGNNGENGRGEAVVGEALPSYNEIEWTVRVRQPRVGNPPRERISPNNAPNERAFAGHGQDGVLGLALVH